MMTRVPSPKTRIAVCLSAFTVGCLLACTPAFAQIDLDRKSTRLNSSHLGSSYAVFCSKKKILADDRHEPRVERVVRVAQRMDVAHRTIDAGCLHLHHRSAPRPIGATGPPQHHSQVGRA